MVENNSIIHIRPKPNEFLKSHCLEATSRIVHEGGYAPTSKSMSDIVYVGVGGVHVLRMSGYQFVFDAGVRDFAKQKGRPYSKTS